MVSMLIMFIITSEVRNWYFCVIWLRHFHAFYSIRPLSSAVIMPCVTRKRAAFAKVLAFPKFFHWATFVAIFYSLLNSLLFRIPFSQLCSPRLTRNGIVYPLVCELRLLHRIANTLPVFCVYWLRNIPYCQVILILTQWNGKIKITLISQK